MAGLIDRMAQKLNYDPHSGLIYRDGKVAGGDKGNGYIRIRFEGQRYAAHRVAWALFYGAWPDGEIDHINRNRSDNRIENLRVATREQNMRNRSNVAGVAKERNSWRAYIWTESRLKHLGTFKCFGVAMRTRRNAEADIWGADARTVVIVEAAK